MKNFNIKSGFTLLELLVVVLIIGILAAIAVPQYRFAVMKARFSQLISTTRAIKDAQDRYILQYGERSTDLKALDIEFEGATYKTTDDTNDQVHFDWGYCSIGRGHAYQKAFGCFLTPSYLGYFRSFVNNVYQICCAPASLGDLGRKLCQQEFPEADPISRDDYCGEGGTIYKRGYAD